MMPTPLTTILLLTITSFLITTISCTADCNNENINADYSCEDPICKRITFTFTSNGKQYNYNLVESDGFLGPNFEDHDFCHYVNEDGTPWAVVNTCDDVYIGMFDVDGMTKSIRRHSSSKYLLCDGNLINRGSDDKDIEHNPRSLYGTTNVHHSNFESPLQSPITFKLVIVNDLKLSTRYFPGKPDEVIKFNEAIAMMIDKFYQAVKIRIELSNSIVLTSEVFEKFKNLDEHLEAFGPYSYKNFYLKEDYDLIAMISGHDYPPVAGQDELGLAWRDSICVHSRNAQVILATYGGKLMSTEQLAVNLAHEIGHTLGLKHDNKYGIACKCPEAHCIMNEKSKLTHSWSECSKNQLDILVGAENSKARKCAAFNREQFAKFGPKPKLTAKKITLLILIGFAIGAVITLIVIAIRYYLAKRNANPEAGVGYRQIHED